MEELPESVRMLGTRLAAGEAAMPTAELFTAQDVFAAEIKRIFARSWLAVDHVGRLDGDGAWLRCDLPGQSIVVVRDGEKLHAMRNFCLHAGYMICEEESGHSDRLFCKYHGWEYALDGLLTEPLLRPDREDRSRYRLPRYAVQICRGLVLVDPSTAAPTPPTPDPFPEGTVPDALTDMAVLRRQRHATTWNWKQLHHFVDVSAALFCGGTPEAAVAFGPLSRLLRRGGRAVLLRIEPRFPGHSDLHVVELGAGDNAAEAPSNRLDDAIRRAGDAITTAPAAFVGADLASWYWPLMSET